jgi:hypothetical protein
VARFNAIVAERLRVPVVSLFDGDLRRLAAPLLSFKVSELDEEHRARLAARLPLLPPATRLFLHDWCGAPVEVALVERAAWVHCGNAAVLEAASEHTDRADALWSPGSLMDRRPIAEPEISVLSFGMAHKIRAREFSRLRELLDATGRSYAVYVSTANHESVGLEDGQAVHDEMRALFGSEHLFFLGTLSDVAISNALVRTTFFAAFFPDGVRANNSTVMSALEHGAVVVTNLDQHSPPWLQHGENVLDVAACDGLPLDADVRARIGAAARDATRSLSWDDLADALRAPVETRLPITAQRP